jgi:hypothetical protein
LPGELHIKANLAAHRAYHIFNVIGDILRIRSNTNKPSHHQPRAYFHLCSDLDILCSVVHGHLTSPSARSILSRSDTAQGRKKEGRPGSFLSFWLQRRSIEKGGNLSRLLLPSSVGWNGLTSFAIFLPFYRFANLSRTGRVFFAGRVLVILFFFLVVGDWLVIKCRFGDPDSYWG